MKRYDFDVDIYGTAIVFEKQSGPYVLFSEADARIRELETEDAQWRRVIVTHVDEIIRLKQAIENLEKCLPTLF